MKIQVPQVRDIYEETFGQPKRARDLERFKDLPFLKELQRITGTLAWKKYVTEFFSQKKERALTQMGNRIAEVFSFLPWFQNSIIRRSQEKADVEEFFTHINGKLKQLKELEEEQQAVSQLRQ